MRDLALITLKQNKNLHKNNLIMIIQKLSNQGNVKTEKGNGGIKG